MAQRLEQGTHNPLVAGSNPARPTKSNMRSIRYRSHFFQCMVFRDLCRFRGYSNRYGFSRRLQLSVPEKVAILFRVSRCVASSYFINLVCITLGAPFLRWRFYRRHFRGCARDGYFQSVYVTDFRHRPGFFSARRRYRCPLNGEPPLDGHFLCIFRAAMPYIWIYRQIGSDIDYYR